MVRMKKWLSNYGCGVLVALVNVAILCFVVLVIIEGNRQEKIKAQVEREQYVKDSIAEATRKLQQQRYNDSIEAVLNSKEYKDSVEAAWEKEEKECLQTTSVIYVKGDSLYHSSTFCDRIDGCDNLKLVLLGKALNMGLKECPECNERESVYSGYECGDYIYIDDIDLLN